MDQPNREELKLWQWIGVIHLVGSMLGLALYALIAKTTEALIAVGSEMIIVAIFYVLVKLKFDTILEAFEHLLVDNHEHQLPMYVHQDANYEVVDMDLEHW